MVYSMLSPIYSTIQNIKCFVYMYNASLAEAYLKESGLFFISVSCFIFTGTVSTEKSELKT